MSKIEKKEILDDIDKYKSIEAILNQDGGKLLVKEAQTSVTNAIDIIASSYKTATHAELVTLCATLKANLDLLRVFRNAETNRELAEEALKAQEDL